jgi:hypothetical protein
MPWLLESIRATVFAPDIKAVGLLTWAEFTGISPAQTQPQREIDGTVEAGSYMGQWLTMGVARRPGRGPGRADLILSPLNQTVTVPLGPLRQRIEPAAIGPFMTHFEGFVELANRWLSTVTNARRLAVACTLFQRTDTQEEAIEIVLRNVRSFKKVGDDSIVDLAIQLNRPQRSRVNQSISINRFERWSARTVEIVLSPFAIQRPVTIQSQRAQADLDVSTAGEVDIAGRQIPEYLKELTELLAKIAIEDDAP